MIDPLPPELSRFVTGERTAQVTSAAAQDAVRAKLAATLGIATLAGGVATATAATTAGGTTAGTAAGATVAATGAVKSALAIKLIAVAVTVGATAAATTAVVKHESAKPARVERAQPAVTPRDATKPRATIRVEPIEPEEVAPASPPTVEPTLTVEPAPTVEPPRKRVTHDAPQLAAPQPAPPVEPTATAAPARSQSQLLADATRSLSLGDAAHALELIDEDTRTHANGPLVEEREAMRISALSALGRTAEAKDVARQLLTKYPHSIHRRLAERVLAEETP